MPSLSFSARLSALAAAAMVLLASCQRRSAPPEPLEDPASNGAQAAPDATPGKLVVLGSSTAAGIGPRETEQAWVPRYQAYLGRRYPRFELINLAVGGLTTYHVQPSDFTPPAQRPKPLAGKNITAALALTPDAIIVNLPSNDAAENVPPAEQLANLERIAALAQAAHVAIWITTTQPRSFGDGAQRSSLVQVRAAILQRFAPRTLDFWTPFAAPDGSIKSEYDSGDGTHLNGAAHAVLTRLVVAAALPATIVRARASH